MLEENKHVSNLNPNLNPETTIGFQLAKILKLKRRFIDIEMKELGLSRTGWQVLFWLKILGSCSQKELLKNLDIDAAHLARILEDFETKEYITRSPIKGNRRCLFIDVTPYSKQYLMPQIQATIEKESAILLDGVSDANRKLLITLLKQIETNIESLLIEDHTMKDIPEHE